MLMARADAIALVTDLWKIDSVKVNKMQKSVRLVTAALGFLSLSLTGTAVQPAGWAPKKGLGWHTVFVQFQKLHGNRVPVQKAYFFGKKEASKLVAKQRRGGDLVAVHPLTNSKESKHQP